MKNETLLLDSDFPDSVVIHNLEYPVHSGFKTGIRMDLAYHNEKYTLEERITHMLYLFYSEIPQDIEAAVGKMLWFYTRGRYDPSEMAKKADTKDKQQPKKKEPREFCFSQDAELILSAFYAEYGIMLNRLRDDDLHWWEFMALFAGLPEETIIKRYIDIRTCSLSGLSEEKRKQIKKIRSKIQIRREIKDADLSPAMRLQKRNEEWLEYVRKQNCEAGKT